MKKKKYLRRRNRNVLSNYYVCFKTRMTKKNNISTINVFKTHSKDNEEAAGEEINSNTSKSQNMDYIKHRMKFSTRVYNRLNEMSVVIMSSTVEEMNPI